MQKYTPAKNAPTLDGVKWDFSRSKPLLYSGQSSPLFRPLRNCIYIQNYLSFLDSIEVYANVWNENLF